MTLDRDTFVYDGGCNFCVSSVRWLKERADGSVVFLPAEPGLLHRAGLSSADTAAAAILVTTDGRRFVGSLALGEVLRRSARVHLKLAGRLLLEQPSRLLGEMVYRWVARNRHRLPWR
ncbi:MAG TPA: DUF393 domain-containing protein [Propionibacteriaceae bacterium]|nr:DUF393 domain-containing protein [Propionibacteriaceae bacterium]